MRITQSCARESTNHPLQQDPLRALPKQQTHTHTQTNMVWGTVGTHIRGECLGMIGITSTCFPISFFSFSNSLSTSDLPFLYFDSKVDLASSYARSILSPTFSTASSDDSRARRASISAFRRASEVLPPEV